MAQPSRELVLDLTDVGDPRGAVKKAKALDGVFIQSFAAEIIRPIHVWEGKSRGNCREFLSEQ